jgi:hypothetical protein
MIQDGEEARETAGLILDLVFHDGQVQAKSTAQSWLALEKRMKVEYWSPKPQPTRPASSLTELQRDVLAVIAAHDPVWRDKHDLLKLYGLPITRDELRNFIG